MTNIRRYYRPGSIVFITSVCYQRQPLLKQDTDKELLLSVMREIKADNPYKMEAYVIMDNHFHWMIKPGGDGNFSAVMQSLKLGFTHLYKAEHGIEGNFVAWQRRFWDHVIRDEDDLKRHMDYVHYNPVKHGCAGLPLDYPWSSFRAYVAKEYYAENWGEAEPAEIKRMDFE
ncbi:MAG: transposase [Gammaproteobacteria bacterium]|nr:transposase [Gammaproteobacteria bacterium]